MAAGFFNLPVTPVFKALTKIKQIEVIVYFCRILSFEKVRNDSLKLYNRNWKRSLEGMGIRGK
ncbi:hypothetical protein F0M21_17190 [Bacillus velezensis]|uniref:Uncharacterized protein n=2 Tax=Bacillus velezensis TaxID=492670 RepID=A0A4Y6AB05_BACVZ|nr:hypothetical protein MUS_3992 [Bacillus velezensis YAU B9601-Y2]AGZ58182.1 hypothetical protein U471_34840 [Bacillus amyloliquefaciens CC178]AHK50835.1 hypothetical protein AJ82_18890 [Bacillus velezensis TrigoCor1448]APH37405.1 hypothetical protein BHE96_18295 [Bacillus subtilis]ARJ73051.1 hypothetical protein B7941_00310 [Bacillus velezensis]ATV24448.1 hypothetical protein CS547_17600 [Bacillus sp. Lzh-5]AWM45780.1 hypothetical protein BAALB65_17800 [Bacillus amyloliquefaciens]EIF14964.